MKESSTPHNNKGQKHGKWIKYYSYNGHIFDKNALYYEGYWFEGKQINYWKWYLNNKVYRTEFHII